MQRYRLEREIMPGTIVEIEDVKGAWVRAADLQVSVQGLRADLDEVVGFLRRLEFCVDDSERTGKDVLRCPTCMGGYMPGFDGKHALGCGLEALLKKHQGSDALG
jgi:hypothetical protein